MRAENPSCKRRQIRLRRLGRAAERMVKPNTGSWPAARPGITQIDHAEFSHNLLDLHICLVDERMNEARHSQGPGAATRKPRHSPRCGRAAHPAETRP